MTRGGTLRGEPREAGLRGGDRLHRCLDSTKLADGAVHSADGAAG